MIPAWPAFALIAWVLVLAWALVRHRRCLSCNARSVRELLELEA